MNRRNFLRGLGGGALLITTGSFVAEFLKRLPGATVSTITPDSSSTVRVRIIGPDGKLTAPIEMPKVVKSDAEWRKPVSYTHLDVYKRQILPGCGKSGSRREVSSSTTRSKRARRRSNGTSGTSIPWAITLSLIHI